MLLDCKRTGIVILTLFLAITLSAQNRVVTYDTVKTNVLKTIGNRYSVFVPSVSSNDTLATRGYVGTNSVWLDSVSHHNTRISYLEDSVQKATKYHTQAITSISYLTDSLSTRYWRGDTSYALASKNWVSGNYALTNHTQSIASVTALQDSLTARYWRGDTLYALASKQWVIGRNPSIGDLSAYRLIVNTNFPDNLSVGEYGEINGGITFMDIASPDNLSTFLQTPTGLTTSHTITLPDTNGTLSLTSHTHTGVYQPSGTYLIPNDSTANRTFSNLVYLKNADSTTQRTFTNAQLALKLNASDTTTFRTFSNLKYQTAGSYQPAGTYLVPNDSTAIRTFSNLKYQSTGSYQPAGTYIVPSDTTANRTFSDLKYQATGNYQLAGTYLIPADSTANRTFSNLKYATVDSLATHRTAINSLTDSVTKATKYHTQSISSVTGLQDSLNKAMDSITVVTPLTKIGTATQPTISIPAASASASGYLTSADWTMFNNGIIQNQLFETDINGDAMPSTTGTVSLVFELDENSDITPKP